MISQRKEFTITLALTFLLVLIAIVQYFAFLKSYRHAPADLRTPQEYNAFLARHHRFDSAILGSSLSMCFRCTEFDRLCNGYSYKLTVAGCEVPVWTEIGKFACKYQKIHAILADLHLELLLVPPANMNIIEEYYADRTLWMDVRAGASLKSLRERWDFYGKLLQGPPPEKLPPVPPLPPLQGPPPEKFPPVPPRPPLQGPPPGGVPPAFPPVPPVPSSVFRDELYNWSRRYPCGKIYLARQVVLHSNKPDMRRKASCVSQNLRPLIKFVEENPQIRFYLYLPPCSALAYNDRELFLHARKTVMDLLLPLPNVELYDFQAADFVTEWNCYKDLTHFSPEVSSWIIRQMMEQNYRITPENRASFERRFEDVVLSFDREKAIAELTAYYYAHAPKKKGRRRR